MLFKNLKDELARDIAQKDTLLKQEAEVKEKMDKAIEDIVEVLNLREDILDFEITSNRPDCFSIEGLGRETAVSLGKEFKENNNLFLGSNIVQPNRSPTIGPSQFQQQQLEKLKQLQILNEEKLIPVKDLQLSNIQLLLLSTKFC